MNDKKIKLELLKLLFQYKSHMLLIFMCIILTTSMGLISPLISKKIVDDGFINRNYQYFLTCVIGLFFIGFLTAILGIIKERFRINIKVNLGKRLNQMAFLHMSKIKVQYLDSNNNSELLNRIYMDIDTIKSIADKRIFSAFSNSLTMLGGAVGLFIINAKLAIIVILFIPLKYFYIKYFKNKGRILKGIFLQSKQSYMEWFGEFTDGIKNIRLFNLQAYKQDEFNDKQERIIESENNFEQFGEYQHALDTVVIEFLIIAIYVYGFTLLEQSAITIGGIFAFISYSNYVLKPIAALFNIEYFLSTLIPSARRFFDFLDTQEEESGHTDIKNSIIESIEFKNVNFSYNENKKILHDFSFKVDNNCKITLIGRNGSGKTTLLNLLLRFYTISSGYILINGKNIYDLNITDYRNLFSVINQDIYLFNDTIRNNICLYKEIENDKLLQIIKDSQLEDLLDAYTLDYIIGQNGAKLSGGQRQKIALARALAKDAPICIFDEFTSNLDEISKQQIYSLFKNRFTNKILIVISHEKDIQSMFNNLYRIE